MNQKRIIFLSSVIIGVLTLTLGITFAVFNFNKTSTNSKLVVGDIYMHYNETNQITIDNAMPSDTYDNTKYFEFTIDGKNTTTDKDIWYEIVLTHGDNHATRTTRIKDDLLNFRLVEIKDDVETVVIENRSYVNLTNQRIWVDTIDRNTSTEVTHTYRLYMWIDNNTIIGNVDQDYTTEEWNDVYASIKVNVVGDFNEKDISTDESCFTVTNGKLGDEVVTGIFDYDETCGSDVIIPKTIQGYPVALIGKYAFKNNQLTSVNIPDSVTKIKGDAFSYNNITEVIIPNSVTYLSCYAFDDTVSITKNDSLVCIDDHQ